MLEFATVLTDFTHYFADKIQSGDRDISVSVDRAMKAVDGLDLGEYIYNNSTYQTSNLAEAVFNLAMHSLTILESDEGVKKIASESIGDKSISYSSIAPQNSSIETLQTTEYGQRYLDLTSIARQRLLLV